MKKLLLISSLLAGAALSVPILAQPSQSPPQTAPDITIQQAAVDFLKDKRSRQDKVDAALRGSGRVANLPQLRRMIAESDFARPATPGVDAQTQAAINDSLITDAAQFLAAQDFAPSKVAAYLRASANPLDAAIAMVRGTPTARDAAILSDRVVIGTVISVEPLGNSDVPTSLVTLQISDTILGSAAQTVSFEQAGTPEAPFQTTLLEGSGESILVFLSDPAGNLRGNGNRNRQNVGVPTNLVSPFVLRGGTYAPLGISAMRPVTLAQLQSDVASIAALRVNK